MSRIRFTKMHGCGNDYIYVDATRYPIADPSAAAIRWSDRHKGIGSDGLVLIDRSPVPERLRVGETSAKRLSTNGAQESSGMADFSMRIFNADGSEAMMCGNASRCIGKYLYERGLTWKTTIRLQTLSGIKTLLLHVEGNNVESVSVDMLEPLLQNETQFLPSCDPGIGTFVSMGNPHYVIFTDDVDQVAEKGRLLEGHPAFPQRCNIEFAHILALQAAEPSPGPSPTMEGSGCAKIRTRVWERGSGITQACGTGACATAVAACLTGRAGRMSTIVMDGGTLSIEWCEQDRPAEGHLFQKNHVYMTGPAAFVFDGEIEI